MSATTRLILLFVVLLTGMAPLKAQNTWTGNTSTAWNNAGNWTAGIPVAGANVVIPDVTNDPVLTTTTPILRSVVVQTGAILTINATAELIISGNTTYSLHNQGTIHNNGTITLGDRASLVTDFIRNEGTFNNNSGATIFVGKDVFSAQTAINNLSGVINNRGTVDLAPYDLKIGYGILNTGTFSNYSGGSIVVGKSTVAGIYHTTGSLNNDGTISIATYGDYCLWTRDMFVNTGTLRLDAADKASLLQERDTLINTGNMILGATGELAPKGIDNRDYFENSTTGTIYVDNASFQAVWVGSMFVNQGTLAIGALSTGRTIPRGIDQNSNIRNTGQITIDRATVGIYAYSHRLENAGTITIGATAAVTTLLQYAMQGVVSNNSNGKINGSGNIRGVVYEGGGGQLSPGYAGSPGTINFSATQRFTNNLLAIDVNNAGIAGTDYDQVVVQGTAQLGGTIAMSINYTPADGDQLTLITATAVTGTFSAITGISAGWKIAYTGTAVTLTYSTTNTWTGAINTDWNNAGNWTGGVPIATSDVLIPDVTNDPVISTAGALAKTMTIETGSALTISSTGTLTCNGAPLQGILNKGTVTNNGSMVIGNTASSGNNGIDNTGNFYNNAGATIRLDRTIESGIFNHGGIFINDGAIIVGAIAGGNTINWGIWNEVAFTNNAQLQINRVAGGIALARSAVVNKGTITLGDLTPITTLLANRGNGVLVNETNGELKGSGNIDDEIINASRGKISPGYADPGQINFGGNTSFSNAVFSIDIKSNGTTIVGNDKITVNGTATLGGSLVLSAINGSQLTAGQTITVLTAWNFIGQFASITWPAGVTGVANYGPTSVTLSITSILPLKLLSFIAREEAGKMELQWKTAQEQNTAAFDIERSSDGLNYTVIGTIRAAGEGANSYAFTDVQPATGINYYRLKMRDIDDRFTISQVIPVRTTGTGGLRIAPVPANSYVTLTLKDLSWAGQHAQVYDAAGHLMIDLVLKGSVRIDMASWPAGTYLIKTQHATYRLVKQ